jgi:hypothetical protein
LPSLSAVNMLHLTIFMVEECFAHGCFSS